MLLSSFQASFYLGGDRIIQKLLPISPKNGIRQIVWREWHCELLMVSGLVVLVRFLLMRWHTWGWMDSHRRHSRHWKERLLEALGMHYRQMAILLVVRLHLRCHLRSAVVHCVVMGSQFLQIFLLLVTLFLLSIFIPLCFLVRVLFYRFRVHFLSFQVGRDH